MGLDFTFIVIIIIGAIGVCEEIKLSVCFEICVKFLVLLWLFVDCRL